LIVPVPMEVLPSLNVTVPVGPLETVARRVTAPPYADGEPELVTVICGVVFVTAGSMFIPKLLVILPALA